MIIISKNNSDIKNNVAEKNKLFKTKLYTAALAALEKALQTKLALIS